MQSYKVKEVRVHPNFRAHGFYNDVAIFMLDGKAKYTDYVRPVCLPSTEDDEFSLVGEIPTVTGFGATDYGNIFLFFTFSYTSLDFSLAFVENYIKSSCLCLYQAEGSRSRQSLMGQSKR